MDKIIEFKGNELEEILSDDITLVELGSITCGPCQELEMRLDKLSKDIKYPIIKVEVYDYPHIATKYKVKSIPMLLIFKGKEKRAELKGLVSVEKIKEKVEQIENEK